MNSSKSVSIHLQGVGKIFPGEVEAVRNVDLSISSGRVVALLGPTGCGKTTILRMIGGLEEPTSGMVRCDPKDSVVGYCFQEPRLLPWRTVRRNVGLPLELQGVAESQRDKVIDSVLGMVGLQDASDRFPAALSGGMQMRTSLARSLVCEPELLLLDEPFAALDEVTRLRLDEEVSALVRRRGITTLIVTHSITEAVFIAVGTPTRRGDGHADLSYVMAAAEEIARTAKDYIVIVTKSTVPVGTNRQVKQTVKKANPQLEVLSKATPLAEL